MESGPSGLRRPVPKLTVESLPVEVVEAILSYLSYDEISANRRVSRRFNSYCQRLLNQGFFRAERFHAKCLKAVKKQLPRRESERRTHPLARHCEILTSIETRLSLLSMTFMKYMDMGLCCFIPGKVIDEIFRVLRLVQKGGTPPRAHEILQELRDISSMAMEHFDERIAPDLKLHMAPMKPPHLSFLASGQGALHQCPGGVEARTAELAAASSLLGRAQKTSVHAGVRSILNEEMKQLRTSNSLFRKTATECKAKLTAQAKKLREQSQQLAEQGSRLAEQEGKLNEMNRKLLEQHREFSDVLEEVSRLREQVLSSCAATAAGAKGGAEAAPAVVENARGRPRRKRSGPVLAMEVAAAKAAPNKRSAGDKRRSSAQDQLAPEKKARRSPRTRSEMNQNETAGCSARHWK